MLDEIWKPYPHNANYEVSSMGRVRREAKVLPQHFATSGGYPKVQISRGPSSLVHRLVLETFVGPPPFNGAVTRHLDGNPQNNCLSNLAWGTQADNAQDSKRHGVLPKGEQSPVARYTNAQVEDMRAMRANGSTLKAIAEKHGCSISTVSQITTGASRSYDQGGLTKKHTRNAPGARTGQFGCFKSKLPLYQSVWKLTDEGKRHRDVADTLGISRARVSQIARMSRNG